MADNFPLPTNTGTQKAAGDEVTYSGDSTALVQLFRFVGVTGAEGSKTVVEPPAISTSFGMPVEALRVKPDGTNVMPSLDAAARRGYVQLTDGTNTVTVANSALQVTGGIAHDAADAGNPVKVGARAIPYAAQTAVAADDRSDLFCDRHGVLFVIAGHPDCVTIELAITALQTDVAVVTVSAGTKIVVTQAQVLADNANTAFPQVRVGFGATNTPTTTGVVLTHPGVPAGGGVSRGDGSGILGVGADGEDLRVTCAAPTGGSLRLLVTYYTIPS